MNEPISDPDAIPEPTMQVPKIHDLLERGWPGEILPGTQLDKVKRAAEAYVRDQSNPPNGRVRVREVWLQGRYQPAYQRVTPRKDKEPDFG